jgi:hypothetical protein
MVVTHPHQSLKKLSSCPMTNDILEPLTDEMMCEIAADAMFDVMTYAMTTGYVSLQDIHLAIGRAVEQAHGIGIKQ